MSGGQPWLWSDPRQSFGGTGRAIGVIGENVPGEDRRDHEYRKGHAHEIFALDFTIQLLWDCSVKYVLLIMALDSRRIIRTVVTSSPTSAWIKRQLKEATPYGFVPRFTILDNDKIFGQCGWRHRCIDRVGA